MCGLCPSPLVGMTMEALMEKLRAKADGQKTLADTSKIVSSVFIKLFFAWNHMRYLLLKSRILSYANPM